MTETLYSSPVLLFSLLSVCACVLAKEAGEMTAMTGNRLSTAALPSAPCSRCCLYFVSVSVFFVPTLIQPFSSPRLWPLAQKPPLDCQPDARCLLHPDPKPSRRPPLASSFAPAGPRGARIHEACGMAP